MASAGAIAGRSARRIPRHPGPAPRSRREAHRPTRTERSLGSWRTRRRWRGGHDPSCRARGGPPRSPRTRYNGHHGPTSERCSRSDGRDRARNPVDQRTRATRGRGGPINLPGRGLWTRTRARNSDHPWSPDQRQPWRPGCPSWPAHRAGAHPGRPGLSGRLRPSYAVKLQRPPGVAQDLGRRLAPMCTTSAPVARSLTGRPTRSRAPSVGPSWSRRVACGRLRRLATVPVRAIAGRSAARCDLVLAHLPDPPARSAPAPRRGGGPDADRPLSDVLDGLRGAAPGLPAGGHLFAAVPEPAQTDPAPAPASPPPGARPGRGLRRRHGLDPRRDRQARSPGRTTQGVGFVDGAWRRALQGDPGIR